MTAGEYVPKWNILNFHFELFQKMQQFECYPPKANSASFV